MSDEHKAYASTSAATLEAHILSVNSAKSEAEWWAQREIERLRAENEKLRAALIDTLASLVASVDLLERGGKKAAPSDKMFAQMLVDYNNSIERGRAAAAALKETGDE